MYSVVVREQARTLRGTGLTTYEIADALGVSQAAVAGWLNPDAAEGRRQGIRAWRRTRQGRTCGLSTHVRRKLEALGRPEAFVEDVDPQAVWERNRGVCGICGEGVQPPGGEEFTIDHIVSLRNGGEHSYANVQSAHRRCNSRKGSQESRR